MKKKILSALLALVMTLTLLPAAAQAASTNPFTDVAAGAYYHDPVIWAKDKDVTTGTSATTFSPSATCTRGQVVTFLWRAIGQPEPKTTQNPFADVKTGDYYYKPVLWAVEQGITTGTSSTAFSPADTCTGGQVVTFLYRANGSPVSSGTDSPYYAKAVAWAADKGLMDGMSGFDPAANSPRSAIVTYLYRNAGSPKVEVDTPAAPQTTLYKVSVELDEGGSAPFRPEARGAIIGHIPSGRVVEVLSYDKDGYAKVKWNGYEVYVWAGKLKKVNAPDAVCSAWAQEWMTAADGEYVGLKGEWTGAAGDYTRAITRGDMAKLLVQTLSEMYPSTRLSDLPIVISDTYDYGAEIGTWPAYLVRWGVVPFSYFKGNLDKPATYGEATNYLLKLMAYEAALYVSGGAKAHPTFTANHIKAYSIGGNTAPTANCTYEQLWILKDKTRLWLTDANLKAAVDYETSWYQANPSRKEYEGMGYVGTNTYTIQTALGSKGAHPYVTINADGEGELQSGKPQSFKVTLLGSDLRGCAYTIQTADGRYLAISGMAVNGSRLIAQSAPYRWYISGGREGYINSAENGEQALNASAKGTKDGTAVISYLKKYEQNYKFYFELAK